jgi:tetratricopeptide (TPR) repeat protein
LSARTGAAPNEVARSNLAEVLRRGHRLAEAETLAREALALNRAAGTRTLGEASSLAVLGRVLADRGELRAARESLAEALAIRRERLVETHPDVVRVRGYLEALPPPTRQR